MLNLIKMSLPTTANIFVPFLPTALSRQNIIDKFDELNIGKIVYIDLHKKKINTRSSHSFAFLKIEPDISTIGRELCENLMANRNTTTYYSFDGETHRVDMKPYLSVDIRKDLGYKLSKINSGSAEPEWLNEISKTPIIDSAPIDLTYLINEINKASLSWFYPQSDHVPSYFSSIEEQREINYDYNSIEHDIFRTPQDFVY